MSTATELSDNIDLERGHHCRHHRYLNHHLTRQSGNYSDTESELEEDKEDDQSVCFSDPEDEESTYSSSHSIFYSATGGSFDGGYSCLGRRFSSASEMSVTLGVDEEEDGCGSEGFKVAEKDCRICHLSLVTEDSNEVEDEEEGVGGVPIELGCNCKGDLGVAHKHCAEAWFKIKGNKICEICNCTAKNVSTGTVVNELIQNLNDSATAIISTDQSSPAAATTTTSSATAAPLNSDTQQRFWQGHRFLNFLLACVVFAFVISWLFHFKIPST